MIRVKLGKKIIGKQYITEYRIHPKTQEWICKFMVWKDEFKVCYFSYFLYNNCKQCPFKAVKRKAKHGSYRQQVNNFGGIK